MSDGASNRLVLGDCVKLLEAVPAGSVDLALTDPPYGGTENAWDVALDMDAVWAGLKRVLKPGAAALFFSQAPYSAELGMSNRAWYRYEWIWMKDIATGFMNANRAPLKLAENILVFCSRQPPYFPQKDRGNPYVNRHGGRSETHPNWRRVMTKSDIYNGGDRYPLNVLFFATDRGGGHPTPKPVSLCEYLIRTHSSPGGLVLDLCAGGGPVPEAAMRCGREWLAFEKEPAFHAMARERLERVREELARSVLAPLTRADRPAEPEYVPTGLFGGEA